MTISSLIIETLPSYTRAVSDEAARREGIEVHGLDEETGKIVITIEANGVDASHKIASDLIMIKGVKNVDLVVANFEDDNLPGNAAGPGQE
jgi:nitrate reductase NapD